MEDPNTTIPADVAPMAPPRQRKPRSDAGKPRKARKAERRQKAQQRLVYQLAPQPSEGLSPEWSDDQQLPADCTEVHQARAEIVRRSKTGEGLDTHLEKRCRILAVKDEFFIGGVIEPKVRLVRC